MLSNLGGALSASKARGRRLRLCCIALVVASVLAGAPASTPKVGADGELGLALPNGYFYGQPGGGQGGFAVADEADGRLWTAVQDLGGVEVLGFPLSRRFVWDGFVSQVMQRGVLQWRPERGQVTFVNVLDRLSAAGLDAWLRAKWMTPAREGADGDQELPWGTMLERHLALLDGSPAIRERFLAEPRWLDLFGLPIAAADYGDVYVVRAQRVIFQQWQIATPWSRPGDVMMANVGEVLRDSGLLDPALFVPEPWPPAAREPRRLRIPALGLAAPVRAYDLEADGALPVPDGPDLVAWYRRSALPGARGNSIVAGHLDWRDGRLGVFWRLKELRPGDAVLLETGTGGTARYRVAWSRTVRDGEAPLDELIGPTRMAALTLITCEGEFDRLARSYDQRRIVRAVLDQ